jgi:hypothetical protein
LFQFLISFSFISSIDENEVLFEISKICGLPNQVSDVIKKSRDSLVDLSLLI